MPNPIQKIHLDANRSYSCHWNSMRPVFIAIHQAKLLPDGAEVTPQAAEYFGVIRDLAGGMLERMKSRMKVCDTNPPQSCW